MTVMMTRLRTIVSVVVLAAAVSTVPHAPIFAQTTAPDSGASEPRGSGDGTQNEDGNLRPEPAPRGGGEGEAARPAAPDGPRGCPYREGDLNLLV